MSDEIERWARLGEQATPGPLRESFGNVVVDASGNLVYVTHAFFRARAVADATLVATDLTVRNAVVAVVRAAEAACEREIVACITEPACHRCSGCAMRDALDHLRAELRRVMGGPGDGGAR